MVTAFSPSDTVTLRPGIKAPVKETLLTPRFYTTDFEAIANMVLDLQDDEIAAALDELRADYNRHHFIRDDSFDGSIDHINTSCFARHIIQVNKILIEMYQLTFYEKLKSCCL